MDVSISKNGRVSVKNLGVKGLRSLAFVHWLHLFMFQKKPIIQLKAASALNRILVLCDSTLTMLNMLDLEVSDALLQIVASN